MRQSVSAVTIALLLFATTSFAQNAEAERKTLFRDGSAAADAGQWSVAAEKFRRVIEIRSAPKALIALAIAEEHLGRFGSAKRDYEKASADAHASRLLDDEAVATQALASVAARVPMITVHVPHPDRVRTVTLDGKPVALDAMNSVDPGKHTVEGHGDSEFREVVEVKEGEHRDVSVDLTARTTTPIAPQSVNPETSSHGVPVGAITLGVVGLVGMGIASGLCTVGQGQDNDVKTQCGGQTTNCPISSKSEADSASTNIIAGDVVFVIGTVLAVAGATWFVLATLSHSKPTVAAWISPMGCGVRGSF